MTNHATGREAVTKFYDSQAQRKVRDFVCCNQRVELAFDALVQWIPPQPTAILEIGCGIGSVSWRLARKYPDAQVVGMDLSPSSIEFARLLFSRENLRYQVGVATDCPPDMRFDAVLLMDVYEHIPREDRAAVHSQIRSVLSERGRVLLSTPSPSYLDWLSIHKPEELQPIDERVQLKDFDEFASSVDRNVLFYKVADVWHSHDYCYTVLGNSEVAPLSRELPVRSVPRVAKMLAKLSRSEGTDGDLTRAERMQIVESKLGKDSLTQILEDQP